MPPIFACGNNLSANIATFVGPLREVNLSDFNVFLYSLICFDGMRVQAGLDCYLYPPNCQLEKILVMFPLSFAMSDSPLLFLTQFVSCSRLEEANK